MKILAIGNEVHLEELQKKLGPDAPCTYLNHGNIQSELVRIAQYDLLIDLSIDHSFYAIAQYVHIKGLLVLGGSVAVTLKKIYTKFEKQIQCKLVGFNALPTFINRPLWEMALHRQEHLLLIDPLMKKLGINYQVVNDTVGMVTPRVLFMIINEACFSLHAGTATMTDIDLAMKLGTNYPYGPFEWCDRIGVKYVYEVLDAIYNEAKDERYLICPLLKEKYLAEEKFYG